MKQNDFKELKQEIAKSGCYFLSLCKIAEKYINYELKYQDVLEIYYNIIKKDFMLHNCFIVEPVLILNFIFKMFGVNKKCVFNKIFDKANFNNPTDFTDFIAKVSIKNITPSHFLVVDKNLKIIYDPDKNLEKQQDKYIFSTIRAFNIK